MLCCDTRLGSNQKFAAWTTLRMNRGNMDNRYLILKIGIYFYFSNNFLFIFSYCLHYFLCAKISFSEMVPQFYLLCGWQTSDIIKVRCDNLPGTYKFLPLIIVTFSSRFIRQKFCKLSNLICI